MASPKCPICGREVPPQAPSLPFCGERCRVIDLGHWLDERYVVRATEDDDAGTPGEPPPEGSQRG